MDNQEYLNQIAAKSAPVKPQSSQSKFDITNILHSKFFLVGAIGLIAFIFVIILGAAVNGGKTDTTSNVVSLKLHSDNTSEVINTYQPKVKSSKLRSYNASLLGLLSSLSSNLSVYLETETNVKDPEDNDALVDQAATEKDALESELFEAKINGNLDRILAHKMAFEISTFMNEELTILQSTESESLQTILNESYSSLENLYNSYNDFSETK